MTILNYNVSGLANCTLERNYGIDTSLGFDNWANWTRLGFIYDTDRFAKIHEERSEIFRF